MWTQCVTHTTKHRRVMCLYLCSCPACIYLIYFKILLFSFFVLSFVLVSICPVLVLAIYGKDLIEVFTSRLNPYLIFWRQETYSSTGGRAGATGDHKQTYVLAVSQSSIYKLCTWTDKLLMRILPFFLDFFFINPFFLLLLFPCREGS